jgi:hypothetical protein
VGGRRPLQDVSGAVRGSVKISIWVPLHLCAHSSNWAFVIKSKLSFSTKEDDWCLVDTQGDINTHFPGPHFSGRETVTEGCGVAK